MVLTWCMTPSHSSFLAALMFKVRMQLSWKSHEYSTSSLTHMIFCVFLIFFGNVSRTFLNNGWSFRRRKSVEPIINSTNSQYLTSHNTHQLMVNCTNFVDAKVCRTIERSLQVRDGAKFKVFVCGQVLYRARNVDNYNKRRVLRNLFVENWR